MVASVNFLILASDVIRRHRSGSPLVQVMAWCRQATSRYLNQYWPLINEVLWYTHESNIVTNVQVTEFENYTFKWSVLKINLINKHEVSISFWFISMIWVNLLNKNSHSCLSSMSFGLFIKINHGIYNKALTFAALGRYLLSPSCMLRASLVRDQRAR